MNIDDSSSTDGVDEFLFGAPPAAQVLQTARLPTAPVPASLARPLTARLTLDALDAKIRGTRSANAQTYSELQDFVTDFGLTKSQLSARLKGLGVKQPTTVKWLKNVSFTDNDCTLPVLDAALLAEVADGGRVAYRLLNQYVHRHGFDRARLEAHLLSIIDAPQVSSMLMLIHFPGIAHLAAVPAPAQEPVARQRAPEPLVKKNVPAITVTAKAVHRPAQDPGQQPAAPAPAPAPMPPSELNALRDEVDRLRAEQEAVHASDPERAHALVDIIAALIQRAQNLPMRPPPAPHEPAPQPPDLPPQPFVPALPLTAAAMRRATMDELVALKTTGTRFGVTHKQLLQDLVSTHGMDKHSIQTFLERQMGCANAGAKYWMSSIQFDLTPNRGAMHAFVRTVNGQPLAPLTPLDLERGQREEEAALRTTVCYHAGLEKRRVDAMLRWGTVQWELQRIRLVADQSRHWKSAQMGFVRVRQREEQVAYWASEVGRLRARMQQLANCASWTIAQMTSENAGMASAGFAQREAQARDRYLTTLQLLRTAPCHECNVAHYGDALHAHASGGNPVDVCGSCKRYLDKGESPPCSWNSLKCCIVPPTLLQTKSCELHFVRKVHAFMMIVRLSGGQLDLKGSSIIHIADSAKMMDVLNSVPHATICLIKDGVAVNDSALYARKLQIRRACSVLRLCGHPMYADAEIVELGDEAHLALHEQLPADEDAAAAIEADPEADDISPAVAFPRAQGAPVNVAVRRHVERDVFVELFPDGRNTWSDVKDRPGMTMLKYVRSRLGSWDHRFERNIPYIFFWLNEIERQQLSSGITVSLDFQTARLCAGVWCPLF